MAKKKKKGGDKKSAPKVLTAREAIKNRDKNQSRKQARKTIHPEYIPCKIVCGCGNVVETRATVPEIQIGVCSKCHPFFTGTQRFVDSAGRVEKFQRRYKWDASQALVKPGKEQAEEKKRSK